jgi:DtxR family Mn-dependent transcriptional regulator
VAGALRLLSEKELVHYTPYDAVTLTEKGRKVAENVLRRHEALRQFLIEVLQLDSAAAETTACQLEHGVSENVIDRLTRFVDFIKECPRGGYKWVNGLAHNCNHGIDKQACECCLTKCLESLRETMDVGEADIMEMKLSELRVGEKASIKNIDAAGTIRRRLLDMGATPGTIVEIEKVAPLGDPIEVKIKGYHLSLRKEEAAAITVGKAQQ